MKTTETRILAESEHARDGIPPLRVAIIGGGMIADVHRRAARTNGAVIAGVLGSSPKRSQQIAEEWSLSTGYQSIEELLEDQVDVVHICTPNDTHLEYALAVIAAGIDLIVEKPLATSVKDAQRLADAASAAGVVATVPYVYRYHPLVREIRARRVAGDLGDINTLHGSYLQDWLIDPESSSWRVDPAAGGPSRAFGDIGSHWCDLVEFVSGERITTVSALTDVAYDTRPAPSGPSFSSPGDGTEETPRITVTTEDTAIATFRTANGAVGNTVISQVAAGRKNRLWFELDGTLGSAVFDQEAPETIWLGSEHGSAVLHRGEGSVSADQARLNTVPPGHPMGYTDAFAAFVNDTYSAVMARRAGAPLDQAMPEGLPTFLDGLRSADIIEGVLSSAATASWTPITNRLETSS